MKAKAILGRVLSGAAVLGLASAALLLDPTAVQETEAAVPSALGLPLHQSMPSYGNQPEAVVGEALRVNGQVVDLRQYETDEPAEVVADFYEQSFRKLRPQVRRFQVGAVTHVSTVADDGRMLTAMVFDQGDHTLVVPGISEGAVNPGAEAGELPIPIMPRQELLMTSASDDGGKHAVTAEFVVPNPLAEVTAFYRTELGRLGYTEFGGGSIPGDDSNFTLRFGRGNEFATVGIQGLDEGVGTLVLLLHETTPPEKTP